MVKIIVGLGNPGEKYIKTRHNIGFMAIEELKTKFSYKQVKKFNSICYEINGSEKLILMMPQTYMNNSGLAVQSICAFYKVKIENVIVIHDDIDLELGKIKIKIGGGHGGHNGLRSIDQMIGNAYLRIRLGVGKDSQVETSNYVLQNFNQSELISVDRMIDFITNNISELTKDSVSPNDISRFLNHYK